MRIGLFTDMYYPTVNGVTYVVEGLRRQLEAEGHTVYVFAPAESVRRSIARALHLRSAEPRVIRIPSIDGSAIFEDYRTTIFFPSRILAKIRDLHLDIIHFFNPGQIGLLGVYAAKKMDIPLVGQHCTDLFRYVQYYPNVLPGILALSMTIPFSLPYSAKTFKDVFFLLRPRRIIDWNQDIVKESMTIVYNQCNVVIVPSRKIKRQLHGWEITTPLEVMPNGVDALPQPTTKELNAFKKKHKIQSDNRVLLYVGRLTPEKNLTLLIDALVKLRREEPKALLLYVGESEFQPELASYAAQRGCAEQVRFTGRLPREKLGVAYAASDVFVFPSQTDTQGLVLHEAAHAGLPLVIVDQDVTEVLIDNENGFVVNANPTSIAKKVAQLLEDDELRKKFARRSKIIAKKYSEQIQTKKLLELYQELTRS